jgi:replicative DNA helicase
MTQQTTTSEILDRLPPQNLEAERQAIGAMILDDTCVPDVAAVLQPEQFSRPGHQTLARHLFQMHAEGIAIDATTLVAHLRAAGELTTKQDVAEIFEIIAGTPVSAHVLHHTGLVRETWERREIIHVGMELVRAAWDDRTAPTESIEKAETELSKITETGASSGIIDAAKGTAAALERIEAAAQGRRVGIPTGLSDFDNDLGGLHGGELVVIAARPRVGKTALAAGVALHNATRGNGVLFVSLEMTASELWSRMLCSHSRVDGSRLRNATLTAQDLAELDQAAAELANSKLFIHEGPGGSVADIRRTVASIWRQHELQLVVIDYLGRMTPADPRAKRYEQVGQLARDLKTLARQTGLPVVLLAQLNREIEKAGDHRPRLAHLRESGDIEQEADVVAFIDRPEVHSPNDADLKGKATLIVEKNRNGRTADFELAWNSETTTFSTPKREWYEEFEEWAK